MCGIAGIYNLDREEPINALELERMIDVQSHRGPDDRGVHIPGRLGLAHCRLSILDLTDAGHQPMLSPDGDLCLVFNGEIYNHDDIRSELLDRGYRFRSRSDTEVVLHAYAEWGLDMLSRFNGMFAFAIYDRGQECLLLGRDRFGKKPLFHMLDKRRFLFSSEMKGLLASAADPGDIEPDVLGEYFAYLSTGSPRTIYRNIFKLEPGHYLKITGEGVAQRQYWDLQPGDGLSHDAALIEEKFRDIFEDAVACRLAADVPVGAFLSGGLDSSAVCAAASARADRPLKTFTISFPGFGVDESAEAAAVAAHLGTDHVCRPVARSISEDLDRIAWHLDEPYGAASAVGVYYLSRAAREGGCKVVLSGDGGDEVFAGYYWRHRPTSAPRTAAMPLPLRRLGGALGRFYCRMSGLQGRPETALPPFIGRLVTLPLDKAALYDLSLRTADERILSLFLDPDVLQAFRSREPAVAAYVREGSGFGDVGSRLYADIKTTLVSEMLTKVDRMTMAHGVEARSPFLDYRLAEFAFRLPAEALIDGREAKKPVRRYVEQRVPPGARPGKKGFTFPLDHWFRNDMKRCYVERVLDDSVCATGFFRRDGLERLLDLHLDGRMSLGNTLFALLSFASWLNTVHKEGGRG